MENKLDRENKELTNLIKDPRYTRKFWQSVGNAIANRPCVRLPEVFDKDGNETLNSQIDRYSYDTLKSDLNKLCKDNTEPTELEMIIQSQMIRARFDTSAAVFIRDTLGAKPVDESKMDMAVSNPYENLSDEELEMIKELREKKALELGAGQQSLVEKPSPRQVDNMDAEGK